MACKSFIIASIVCYHTADRELEQAIASLATDFVRRIYIVDNSKSEATRNLCQRLGSQNPKIEYIPNENTGYGAAHNLAIRRHLDENEGFHLAMNPDVRFNPDDLSRLIEAIESDPTIGMVQPRIVNPDGSLQYTVRLLPTPFDLVLRRFLPRLMFPKRRARYELRCIDHDREFNVPYHQGSFMVLRYEALRRAGLFDERFFMYPEDIDLTRRVHALYRTPYVPSMTVVHDHRAASYRSVRMLRIHVVNMVRYFNKWGWFNDPDRRRFNRETLRQQ